jgi:hypothetical protein
LPGVVSFRLPLLAVTKSSRSAFVKEKRLKIRLSALALLVALCSASVLPASAQVVVERGPHRVPLYRVWQPDWDAGRFDRHHVILGRVASFAPYRLYVARRDGVVQQIDLKNGTVILPTGATPTATQHVAVVGYYSRGTFIANRVLLHN